MVGNITEYKGILELRGPIRFDQFYYQGGESDADTVSGFYSLWNVGNLAKFGCVSSFVVLFLLLIIFLACKLESKLLSAGRDLRLVVS